MTADLTTFFDPTSPTDLHIPPDLPSVQRDGFLSRPGGPAVSGGLWDAALLGEGWGQVSLPLPVLHPYAAEVLAERLDLSADALLALARGEAWWDGQVTLPPGRSWEDGRAVPLWSWPPRLQWPPPTPSAPGWAEQQITLRLTTAERTGWQAEGLARTGAAGLQLLSEGEQLTRSVPVPPLRLRPLRQQPGGQRLPGPENRALAELVVQRNRLQRALDLDAPAQVLRTAHRALQLAFEALIETWALALRSTASAHPAEEAGLGWVPAGAPPARGGGLVLGAPLTPTGCAVLGEDELLLDLAEVTMRLRLSDGKTRGVWRSAGLRLIGAVAGVALYDRDADWGVHAFDLREQLWLPRVSAALRRLPLPLLAPGTQRVLSACGRFVWTRPGQILVEGGELVAHPWWQQGAGGAMALALDPQDRWVVVDGGRVLRADGWGVELEHEPLVAALDASGRRLVTVTADAVVVLPLGDVPTGGGRSMSLRGLVGSAPGARGAA